VCSSSRTAARDGGRHQQKKETFGDKYGDKKGKESDPSKSAKQGNNSVDASSPMAKSSSQSLQPGQKGSKKTEKQSKEEKVTP